MASCSGDSCGWIAAIIASLAYGSYGVPIKATLDIDVHPLVLQSYKTIVLFLSCWFVLAFGETAKFTPYGLLSGFLWVSGGTCGIYGIRNAGMAIAVGTWASVMVVMNFICGILLFREPVHSFWGTSFAFSLLLLGLVGMSKYSSKTQKQVTEDFKEIELVANDLDDNKRGLISRKVTPNHEDEEIIPMLTQNEARFDHDKEGSSDEKKTAPVFIGGMRLNQREAGILCAALNGVLAGSSLIPLHYVKAHGFGGLSYFISFGTGSLIANCLIWIVFFVYQHVRKSQVASLWATLENMPAWHFKDLWLRGLMAGLLLSIGMFGSIQATSILGQGVGNSLVQSKILISGLWGIFFYKEIKDPEAIAKWFLSAGLVVAGILLLSYERITATAKPQ
jgi:glucose uptake protein GlcU